MADEAPRIAPSLEMRARMDALDPPVTAEAIAKAGEDRLLNILCSLGDLPGASRAVELGARATDRVLQTAVQGGDHPELVEMLVTCGGGDAKGWRSTSARKGTLLHEAVSAAVVRKLVALGCGNGTPDATHTPLHAQPALPSVMRARVESGGVDPWARDCDGGLALHAPYGCIMSSAALETMLALMVAHRPAELTPQAALAAALGSPSASGGSLLWLAARHALPSTLSLLALGVCVSGLPLAMLRSHAESKWESEESPAPAGLQAALAHAAATLPGSKPANVLVQHARDSPLFTGRVAAWERKRRAVIDDTYAVKRPVTSGTLTEPQMAQRLLLLDETRARQLAALEEDLAAWAWARGVLAEAAASTTSTSTRTNTVTYADWVSAGNGGAGDDLDRVLAVVHATQRPQNYTTLLRYGLRLDAAGLGFLMDQPAAVLRAALGDCGAAAAAGWTLTRAAVAECAAAGAKRRAASFFGILDGLSVAEALAMFDECLKARVKRISAGLKSAVPLPAHSTHNAPLDIVSEYLGFSFVVGALPEPPAGAANAPPVRPDPERSPF